MKTELYANFIENGQEKATKFIISDEWASVEEILRTDAVFSNPKYIKIKIGTTYPLIENEAMEVSGRNLVTGLPKTVTVTSAETERALQGTSNQIITMKKLSGGYKDEDFMTQLNPVLAKVA